MNFKRSLVTINIVISLNIVLKDYGYITIHVASIISGYSCYCSAKDIKLIYLSFEARYLLLFFKEDIFPSPLYNSKQPNKVPYPSNLI